MRANGPTFNGRPGSDHALETTGTDPPERSTATFGYARRASIRLLILHETLPAPDGVAHGDAGTLALLK